MARSAPKFKQQDRYYVICEDSKSSKTYFNEAFKFHRVSSLIKAEHIGKTDPLNIVKEAIKKSKHYTKVYCVIDRDNHQNFDEAVIESRKCDNIVLIVSYPCYELWFILHSGYKSKSYRPNGKKSAAEQLIADLRNSHELFRTYAKGKTIEGLYESIATKYPEMLQAAKSNSDKLLRYAKDHGDLNPSTTIHILLDVIGTLQTPLALPAQT